MNDSSPGMFQNTSDPATFPNVVNDYPNWYGYHCTCGTWVPSGASHVCRSGWTPAVVTVPVPPGVEERLTEIERILKRLEEKCLNDD